MTNLTELLFDEEHLLTRGKIRREADLFLEKLGEKMDSAETIYGSLDLALHALKGRGYVCPRVYRKKGNFAELVRGLDLPLEVSRGKTSFSIRHPALLTIIGAGEIYHERDVHSNPFLISGERDPMYYIRETGMIGVPYSQKSHIYSGEIKGAIIVNYDPGLKFVEDSEIEQVLSKVGKMVGRKVRNLLELNTYIKTNRELAQVNRRLKKSNQKLAELALYDDLTGLCNQRKFRVDIWASFREYKNGQYHLLRMDGDKFKQLNDRYGHQAGDRFLAEVGKALRSVSKAVYRVGGDEFAMVFNGNSQEELLGVVAQLQTKVEGIRIPNADYAESLSLSIGVAPILNARTPEEWVEHADQACYAAKRKGKGQVEFYS